MAGFEGDNEHLDLLRRAADGDVQPWSEWRVANPHLAPDLRRVEMPRAQLAGIDLSGANLFMARLQEADLRGAKLSRAGLVYAHLEGAMLHKVEMMYANLEEAQFQWAELQDAILRHSDLTRASFRGAALNRANLGRVEGEDVILADADLAGANLEKADLWMADLTGARLNGSCLRDANLNQAKLVDADLSGADLIRVRMTGVDLRGARLEHAKIYGLSAWNVLTDATTQQMNLSIAPPGQPGRLTVDDIEVAQLINLLVDHTKLRKAITAIAHKGVLLLGRFSDPLRKEFLESLANAARSRGLLPIIYDLDRPPEQDWTETVLTLANLSLFVIADLGKPASIPLELQALVPNCMVPFVPLRKKDEPAFSMLVDRPHKYDWVLPVVVYRREQEVVEAFDTAVLRPAMKLRRELNQRKAKSIDEKDVADFGLDDAEI